MIFNTKENTHAHAHTHTRNVLCPPFPGPIHSYSKLKTGYISRSEFGAVRIDLVLTAFYACLPCHVFCVIHEIPVYQKCVQLCGTSPVIQVFIPP